MNLFKTFRDDIVASLAWLADQGKLPTGLDYSKVTAEPPREAAHGDVSTNAAMVLAKAAGMKPRDIAELLATELKSLPSVVAAEVAGPGFLNLRLADGYWYAQLADLLEAGTAYGDSDLGAGTRV
ncbi:MAG TPA: arginine--tRNA ligase, partial [Telmatospirillum sp.]|nr:arginine--tRNA ligase [Telmatospirillum sp.]